jgi:hypothetical protein
MSNMEPPPTELLPFDRSAGDLDELLRAFFQAEVPHPWPASCLPAIAARPAAGGRPLWRSRCALAASVAILALASASLSGTFREKPLTAHDFTGRDRASDPLAPLKKTERPQKPIQSSAIPPRR